MCGLLVTARKGRDASLNAFEKGLGSLRHRGPDAMGMLEYRLEATHLLVGHTRLAIQDTTSKGLQPMYKHGLTLVFNGEIYNFKALRQELQESGISFETQSDSEVLLSAWHHWGEDALDRLEGMFAFIVLDKRQGQLIAARDAFGIKPLYFATTSEAIGFCSEPASLVRAMSLELKPNESACLDFYLHGWSDRDSRTFYKGVDQVMPGHVVRVSLGDLSMHSRQWLSLRVPKKSMGSSPKELRSTIELAIQEHQVSDVPVAFALSGGVDSTGLVGLATYQTGGFNAPSTFGYVSDDSTVSEAVWQSIAAKSLGVNHRFVPESDSANLEDMMARGLRTVGEPFAGPSVFAQHHVFRAMRNAGYIVSIDGQGADELFAGYDGLNSSKFRTALSNGHLWLSLVLLSSIIRKGQFLDFLYASVSETLGLANPTTKLSRVFRYLIFSSKNFGNLNFFSSLWLVLRAEGRQFDYKSQFEGRPNPLQKKQAEMLWVNSLPTYLKHADRNSMASSVESRVPYLNLPLAREALSLSSRKDALLFGKKYLLKQALVGIVPTEILEREDKIGFSYGAIAWSSLSAESLNDAYSGLETQSWFRGGKGPEKFFGGLRESARFRALSLGMWLASLESEQPE